MSNTSNQIAIQGRKIGDSYPPLVIAEIGINHSGSLDLAIAMVDAAKNADCECVKFQYHIPDKEMIPNDVVPGNATETIWNIIQKCTLSHEEEVHLKRYVDQSGLIYLSTPFSREAADYLGGLDVHWYKIGSGECNNYPLIQHVASLGKPIVLSTGMNDIDSIARSVQIIRSFHLPYALLHCTSLYPTPYNQVRLGALKDLREAFPDAVIGLSDHSLGNYTCFAAVSLGASILEKHFTSDSSLAGPDIPISLSPIELHDLVQGAFAIKQSLGGRKEVLEAESPTIDFAYASVVAIQNMQSGDVLSSENIWVKRPGTGGILAKDFDRLIGKKIARDISVNSQLSWQDIEIEIDE